MKLINLEQGSEAWLEFRQNGIGASEIASIAEIKGAFSKRINTLTEKLGQKRMLSAFEQNIFAQGHAWEIAVRDAINAEGFTFAPAVVVSTENERFFASLDGLDASKEIILEVKSVVNAPKFEQYKNEVPAHYMAQVQWQLMVTKYATAILAFVHDGEVVRHEIKPDPIYQDILAQAGAKFLAELDAIKAGTMPSPIQTIRSPEIARLEKLKRMEMDMKIQMAMITEEIKGLAERLLDEHKASKIEGDSITVTWQEREGATDYKKACEDAGVDVTGYKKKGSRFVVVKTKEVQE
jgi:putative phage-type endonuclease